MSASLTWIFFYILKRKKILILKSGINSILIRKTGGFVNCDFLTIHIIIPT